MKSVRDLTFKQVVINRKVLEACKTENHFMKLSVELLKEISIMAGTFGGIYPLDKDLKPRKHSRDEAIVAGLMVRLAKLCSGFLDQICKNRLEIGWILQRCISDTIISLKYLIQEGNRRLYDEFFEFSLREEKRLLMVIDENVKKRGKELPIETRMRKSIMDAFASTGLTPSQVDEENYRPWGKSIYQRAKAVGLGESYGALMGLPSHAVHGNWEDLRKYHLTEDKDGFAACHEWSTPRPQIINGTSMLIHDACSTFIKNVLPTIPERDRLLKLIEDFPDRLRALDHAHEQFMQKGK